MTSNSERTLSFWNNHILRWSKKRYRSRIFRSIAYRESLAFELLRWQVQHKSILELGCGVGRLGPRLIKSGAGHYLGVDFSPNAIAEAERNTSVPGVVYTCKELSQVEDKLDLCFSLGLTDWVDDNGLRQIVHLSSGIKYLHSFSEQKGFFHFLYSQVMGRLYRARSVQPRQFTVEEMRTLFNDPEAMIIRDQRMAFGCFITNIKSK